MQTINPAVPSIKINEPAYQQFTLPSLGKFYEGRVLEGKIAIRPMTLKEEQIMGTARLAKTGESLKMLVKNCVKINIPVEEILSADKMAILLWLRQASYGSDYPIKAQCQNPECKQEFEHLINMEQDLNVNYLKENIVEPLTVKLPKSGHTVSFRLSRWKDEDVLARREQNNPSKIDSRLTEQLSMVITSVTGVDLAMIKLWLEGLLAYDASILKDAVNKDYFGIDTKMLVVCPECSHSNMIQLPINENFFRVYQKPA